MEPIKFEFDGFNKELVAQLSEKIASALSAYEFNGFLLGCTFEDYLSDEGKEMLRKEFQPLLVKNVEEKLGKVANYSKPDIEILVNFNQDLVFFIVHSVYVRGRYRKFSSLPQTKHYCFKCKGKGCEYCNYKGTLSSESVEELIAKHAVPMFDAQQAKLHGAGREDVDVRMLGPGREFVLQIFEPKKRVVDLKELEAKVNKSEAGKIEIFNLEYCTREDVAKIKAKKAKKVYVATVRCDKELSDEDLRKLPGSYEIEQRTPLRVMHRRADIVRKRHAEITDAKLEEKLLKLKILAESGLYIKEFVSGDNGRTKPSISEILETKCECIALDVVDIIE